MQVSSFGKVAHVLKSGATHVQGLVCAMQAMAAFPNWLV
jgi:hypothetical protein